MVARADLRCAFFAKHCDANDELHGGDGDDGLFGHGGNDLVYGDAGVDFLRGDDGDDTLYGGTNSLAPDEYLQGMNGNDKLYGEADDDILRGGDGDDTYDGGGGFNRISFYELKATQGASANLSGIAPKVLNDGFGHGPLETIVKTGMSAIQALGGHTCYADTFAGNNVNNFFIGGGGLSGGTPKGDTLMGLGGNDEFQIDDAPYLIHGGAGSDTINVFSQSRLVCGFPSASVQFTTDGVIADLTLGKIVYDGFGTPPPGSGNIQNVENLNGSAGDDSLTGNGGANKLGGWAGNDTINGKGGADTIEGGPGADNLFGAQGADTFVYKLVGDSPPGAGIRDQIGSMNHAQGDRVDLSAIDADGNSGNGDQMFAYSAGPPSALAIGQFTVTVPAAGQKLISARAGGGGVELEILVTWTGAIAEPFKSCVVGFGCNDIVR